MHDAQGEYAKAEPLYARALKMREGLYPKARFPQGHPELAVSLSNLAALHAAREEYAKAEPLFHQALDMYTASATALAASSPEATALNYVLSVPLVRDAYLSTTIHLPKLDVYPAVWQSKAALSRVYERRHLAILAASSKESRELWNAILALERRREAILLAPFTATKVTDRDKQLDEIDEAARRRSICCRCCPR